MLPKIFPPYPDRNDVDLHAILHPAKEVGGDLYDFYMDGNHLYFLIGDVSGKGVPASLFMAITRSLFRTLSQHVLSPAKIGVVEDFKYSDEEVVLEKESKLFLYTDGVTEAENINKELYGEEKLLEMLSDNASSDVRTTVNVVVDSIASHVKEAEASDDLTILLIQYEPGTANS